LKTPIDDTRMILPERRSRMDGSTALVTRDRAEEVRLELITELVQGQVLDEATDPVPRVAHQHVDRARLCADPLESRGHGLVAGHVQCQHVDGNAGPRSLGIQTLSLGRVPHGREDAEAGAAEPRRSRAGRTRSTNR